MGMSQAEVIKDQKMKYNESKDLLIQKILGFIEKGENPPWVKPWRTLGPARNPITGTVYSGINVLILAMTSFGDPRWITFANGVKLGGRLKPDSKSTRIFSAHPKKIVVDNAETGDKDTIFVKRPPKPIAVFNVEQWDGLGLEPLILETYEGFVDHAVLDEHFSKLPLKVTMEEFSDRAYYSPNWDELKIPKKAQFKLSDDFYATFLHEIVHSSGSHKRLNRPIENRFGTKEYAYEELIAEFGSAFLCAEFGINGQCQHPQYIRSWLKALADDKDQLFTAAQEAMAACDWIRENYFCLAKRHAEAESA